MKSKKAVKKPLKLYEIIELKDDKRESIGLIEAKGFKEVVGYLSNEYKDRVFEICPAFIFSKQDKIIKTIK